jgi:endonuclease-8
MPEGDTLFRTAQTLDKALGGRTVTYFETALAQLANVDRGDPIAGRTVTGCESVGKHLLLHFSGDLTLRTHLRMNGAWHIYRPGERWFRPRAHMRVVIATEAYVAVGFEIPVAEFLTAAQLARHPELTRLGPDLLGPAVDLTEVVRRARDRPHLTVAELLLNQRVAAGIGNVYKCEVLFQVGLHPTLKVAAVSDEALREAFTIAQRFLHANVQGPGPGMTTYTGHRKTTRRGERLWVYARAGQPCRRCGTPIAYAQVGEDPRGTYFCPTCQPPVV